MATGNLADEIIQLQIDDPEITTPGDKTQIRHLTDPIENWINSREGGLVLSHEWSGTSHMLAQLKGKQLPHYGQRVTKNLQHFVAK